MRGKITILFVTITQTKDVTSTNAPNANDSNSHDANLRLIVLLIVRQISIVLIPEPDLFICADTLYNVTIHQYPDHIHDTAQTQCLELGWEQTQGPKFRIPPTSCSSHASRGQRISPADIKMTI